MEITQLKYFLEVAQSQHMTRSAQKLHIAQPALTQSIHRLEKELGVPLFLPKGRNIVLTEYGKYLQEKLRPIITVLDGIPEQLRTMANLENETIHLNVLAASSLVTEAIIEYNQIEPHVNFKVLQNDESKLYDVQIRTRFFYQHTEEMEDNHFICTEKIFMAVPNVKKYSNRKSIELSELSEAPFISLLGSKELRSICDKFCNKAGFSPKVIFESDSPVTVRNMIAAKMGVGFWPQFTWGSLDSKDIILLDIVEPSCHRDILIDFRENKADNTYVVAFYSFLKEFFARKMGESLKGIN